MTSRLRQVVDAVRERPPLANGMLCLAITASWVVELPRYNAINDLSTSDEKLVFVIAVATVLVMLFRRHAPFTVFLAVTAMQFAVIIRTNVPPPFTAEWCLYICTYTVGSMKNLRWVVAAVAIATLSWWVLASPIRCACMIQLGTFMTFAAIAGVSIGAGSKLIRELRQQSKLLEATRNERQRLAVEQERSRVARELHDVVAHAVTVMVIQAGAARMVARNDPMRANAALVRVEAMAGEAVRELDTLVGSLGRNAAPETIWRPPSGLAGIRALVELEQATGLDVDLHLEGEPHPLDPAIELSLYRIVQEALTNAHKHAPGAAVRVSLRYQPGSVRVDITNPVPPHGPSLSAPFGFGRGLIGIHERASLFGGDAAAGPTSEGGFQVLARFPLAPVPA